MPVAYKIVKNNRKSSTTFGKFYGRAVVKDTVDTKLLADVIQRNCTVKRSDVMAILTELVEVMGDQLQAGNRVVLDGFGSFKIGLKTKPADKAEDFTASKNIKGMHVNFLPQTTIGADHSRQRTFLSGAKAQELSSYVSPADAKKDDAGSDKGNTGGDTTDKGGSATDGKTPGVGA